LYFLINVLFEIRKQNPVHNNYSINEQSDIAEQYFCNCSKTERALCSDKQPCVNQLLCNTLEFRWVCLTQRWCLSGVLTKIRFRFVALFGDISNPQQRSVEVQLTFLVFWEKKWNRNFDNRDHPSGVCFVDSKAQTAAFDLSTKRIERSWVTWCGKWHQRLKPFVKQTN